MDTFWSLTENGIVRTAGQAFTDTIEMAGNHIAAIVTYGVDEKGVLRLARELYYPQMRVRPRDTYGTLHAYHSEDERQVFAVDGSVVEECPEKFRFDGVLCSVSTDSTRTLCITRWMFPCVNTSAYMEHTVVENISGHTCEVSVEAVCRTGYVRGAAGVYQIKTAGTPVRVVLAPGESFQNDLCFSAGLHTEALPVPDGAAELSLRQSMVHKLCDGSLILDCPDRELVQFFRLAKLRAAESIFDTVEGPLHSPGGGPYYAAVWTNDQAEYAGPFFPFMGCERANKASLNAYQLFARFMSPDMNPIPSSIIDEGRDFWAGAGDRGDAAMYLYGCARYLLAMGDVSLAKELFWTIQWAADYCLSRRTENGIIASDSDELEGRLPSGNANLSTSSLTYAGLVSAAALAKELQETELAEKWMQDARNLCKDMEVFFGAQISGFDTYRYYEGNDVLRSWICLPLAMGIYERKKGTVNALLSEKLFRDDGILSVEGDNIFWDRSTLYAFRGILNAGESDRVYPYMQRYIHRRLLGAHVPYAVEAFPEGNQRHLSAESALFCRVITEGLCGMLPVGLHRILLRPSVPSSLGRLKVSRVCACGSCFDVEILCKEGGYQVSITYSDGHVQEAFVPPGDSLMISL